jgi:endonuclease/exonuclease/phosphatase (EEP) superfamily protein YafD
MMYFGVLRRAVGAIARPFGWLCILGAILALGVRERSSSSQLVIVLACGVPYLTIVAVLGAGVLAALRKWIDAVVGAVLAVVLIAFQAPEYLNSPPASVSRITELSGNMRLGAADAAEIVALARKNHVTVVALQELTPDAVTRLKQAGLDSSYPYSVIAAGDGASGVGLWSRLPISDPHSYPDFVFHEVSARITLDASRSEGTVTFFSTHIGAPWPQSPLTWAYEVPQLARLLSSQTGPIADAGDFNATLDNAQFRKLLTVCGCADAAQQSGSAPDMSYPADVALLPPVIAIDHVVTRKVVAHSVHTVRLFGSDHRGLITRIGLPPAS